MIQVNEFDWLLCPICGTSVHTHLDEVVVASRPTEDALITGLLVDNTGTVNDFIHVPEEFTSSRRHAFTLKGWCEECGGRFAVVFSQHKGSTEVRVLAETWKPT